ncbi:MULTISPECIES: hypothetical protein [unclassified Microbacterium]|uniref:hypothetical protein n=1 Tax=unclassified Microbacterium TaxID=2609290 RepID=UPI00214B777C|nr:MULTISPECIES: hypothetical protein [unclassified Microbacterium]MCR2808400.1 hypothetical protein [Microbacterium sp. zg.B185]WIM19154.1 hypothetical protein QNO12_16500 [Microbacterium sp. zg-B185]
MPDTAAIGEAFADLRETLALDGFALSWKLSEETRANGEIAAGSASCADCLVPAPVLEAILRTPLSATPFELAEVRLP